MQLDERELANFVKEIADIDTVVEYLGLETKKQGRRTMILCPCHNDKHFGSCFLTETGFRCFACNSGGDMIELVQAVTNKSFFDACSYIADIYGETIEKSKEKPKAKKLLSNEKLTLIGLGRDREAEKIWKDISASIFQEDLPEPTADQRIYWSPVAATDDCKYPQDYYILQVVATKNPLQELLETDEDEYNALICRKAIEAAERYQEMIDMAANPAQFYSEDNIDQFLMAHYCSMIANQCGQTVWRNVLREKIRECDNIRIEFSPKNSKKSNSPIAKPKCVFGKVRGGTLY